MTRAPEDPIQAVPPAAVPPEEAVRGAVASDLVQHMVRVSAAMGAGSLAVVVLAAVRTKVIAVHLGPQGVGELGLLLAFVNVASLVFELGIGKSAVRRIAAASGGGESGVTRWTLRSAGLLLAAVAAIAVAALAGQAASIMGDSGLEGDIRLCAIAVAATIIGTLVVAELNGLRRIRALALLQPLAAAAATLLTLAAVAVGLDPIPVVVLAPPLTVLLAALAFARSLPSAGPRPGRRVLVAETRRLAGLGTAIVINTGVAALGALVVRVLVDDELGRVATGELQAAFAVVTLYLGFVFAALGADYLPLLSSLAATPARVNDVVRAQLRVTALVSAPLVMALLVLAPVVVRVFYTAEFGDTADLLRIMLPGEVIRTAAWTIGYVLLAREARMLFVVTELLYSGLLVAATAALLPAIGLEGAAVAFTACQLMSLGWTLVFARMTTGFRLDRDGVAMLGALTAAVAAAALAASAGAAGTVAAAGLTALVCAVAARRLLGARPA